MPICACWLGERFGVPTGEVTPARLSYQLTKRRSKGVLCKVADHNRYTMRDHSYRTTLALTRLHQRLLTPTLE
jgi:hypothetical protein